MSIDPLTGMSNLFGLLEASSSKLFGTCGSIIALDIARFSSVNSSYGSEMGDACICALAGVLNYQLRHCSSYNVNGKTFRIGGDEFILVLPGMPVEDARNVMAEIGHEFSEKMKLSGIGETGLHTAAVGYDESIGSVSALLKLVYIALEECRNEAEVPSKLPLWAERLIDTMIRRISENVVLLQEVRELALTDEISGLPNHRAACMFLEDYLYKYQLHREPFSVLFIDGDNLKQYNNLGYEKGNQMIRNIGKLITDTLRYNDFVARWFSGDEFLVLLSGADRPAALHLAERLRKVIEEKTAVWIFPVTVSIGVASCPEDGVKIDDLLLTAEKANSTAKMTGKNRVS